MREYDIRSLPTFILVTEDGKFIDSLIGSASEQHFRNWLDDSVGVQS